MRVAIAVAVLGGLLVGEALANRTLERVRELERRLKDVLAVIRSDAFAESMIRFSGELARATISFRVTAEAFVAGVRTITGVRVEAVDFLADDELARPLDPDAPTVDSYVGRGEELEALEAVIEEQRERIRRIGGRREEER
ncbi:MAG TPA: hypothetical protein VFT76_02050 [Actinomycetota bacterium]|nr:hypothetical protein [Actinomycetota bacterium]